jgi:hypothetical protein
MGSLKVFREGVLHRVVFILKREDVLQFNPEQDTGLLTTTKVISQFTVNERFIMLLTGLFNDGVSTWYY